MDKVYVLEIIPKDKLVGVADDPYRLQAYAEKTIDGKWLWDKWHYYEGTWERAFISDQEQQSYLIEPGNWLNEEEE